MRRTLIIAVFLLMYCATAQARVVTYAGIGQCKGALVVKGLNPNAPPTCGLVTASGTCSGDLNAACNAVFGVGHVNSGVLPSPNGGAGTVNGLMKANGSGAVSQAISGTDFAPATSGVSLLKGNNAGGFASAIVGTDYAPATSGASLLKGNNAGGFANAVSGTDYAPATSGSALLKANGAGGFSSAVSGTDYQPAIAGNTLAVHNFANQINAAGTLLGAQPASTDLSDLPIPYSSGGLGCKATTFAGLPVGPPQGTQCDIGNAAACQAGTPVTGAGSTPCTLTYYGTSWMPAGNAASGGAGSGSVNSAAIGSLGWYGATGTTISGANLGTGLVKSNSGAAPTAAVAGTDFAAPTSGSSVLLGNGAGGFSLLAGNTLGAHNFANSISAAGVISGAQPAFSDISGNVASAQMPALTGDTTSSAGSTVTVTGAVNGVTYPASPSTDSVPVITAANTATYKGIGNCLDAGGQHLNYNTSTHAFSCGTTSAAASAFVAAMAATTVMSAYGGL